jgi:isochorismate hydrolase
MDRSMQLRHLEEAERHVAQGVRHITEQEVRIADLAREGHDTKEARKLLDNFYGTQALHIQHRDRIQKELEHKAASS